jgi:hypothetical protein
MTHQSTGLQENMDQNRATAEHTRHGPPEKEYPRRVEAFWRPCDVSTGRRTGDASKYWLTLRDILLLFVGILGMYGAQLAAQYGRRTDIRDLKTSLVGYPQRQASTNDSLQRQIDEWRTETKLNRVNIDNNDARLAELKGILLGAGIKGIPR